MDTTSGYYSIADTIIHNPICNYELLVKAHLRQAIEQKRDTIKFFPKYLDTLYKHSGYSRGHCLPYEDFAYSPISAKASMNLLRNLAPQPQNQNIGTKLACENYTRAQAMQYDSLKVYGGTWGSLGLMKGINIPKVYWTVMVYPNGNKECFWMQTTGVHIRYRDLMQWCKISNEDLIKYLGFDPVVVYKQ